MPTQRMLSTQVGTLVWRWWLENRFDGCNGGDATVLVGNYGVATTITEPSDSVGDWGVLVGLFATMVKDMTGRLLTTDAYSDAHRCIGKPISYEFGKMILSDFYHFDIESMLAVQGGTHRLMEPPFHYLALKNDGMHVPRQETTQEHDRTYLNLQRR